MGEWGLRGKVWVQALQAWLRSVKEWGKELPDTVRCHLACNW